MFHPPGAPGAPRIPPPPLGRGQRRKTDGRWLIWTGVFALGVALGAAAYQWVPGVDFYFDGWLALAAG
jgi:hypothetical protein